jgi:hypothetical protein
LISLLHRIFKLLEFDHPIFINKFKIIKPNTDRIHENTLHIIGTDDENNTLINDFLSIRRQVKTIDKKTLIIEVVFVHYINNDWNVGLHVRRTFLGGRECSFHWLNMDIDELNIKLEELTLANI